MAGQAHLRDGYAQSMLRISASSAHACPGTTAHSAGWPLFDTQATRALEKHAAALRPSPTLMQRAGEAVGRLALALAPHARTIWIACGPGNNGGDGLQAAAWLQRWHATAAFATQPCRILVSCTRERHQMPADAQAAWDDALAAGVQWTARQPDGMGPHDLCIDALLGIGLQSRASATTGSDARLVELLHSLHAGPSQVLCVDIASGMDADSGQYLPPFTPGQSTAQSSQRHTLALLTLHPGLFTGAGRDACGQIWWDDLGTGLQAGDMPPGMAPCALLFAPTRTMASPRAHASHKGSYGDVAILGGEGLALRGMSMTGAAWLAALAALHGGAGRVMLSLLDQDSQGQTAPWPEIMLRHPQTQDWQHATVVCGCGGGQAVRPWMADILAQAPRLVLDADGLNAVAGDARLSQALRERAGRGQHTVLTPHPLEAARLLESSTAQVQSDRLQAARELAQRLQCTVLLKGSGTVIASGPATPPQETAACWINPTGNARLATGGTGDVLAGLIAALWAQGFAPAQAAALAAYRHGAVADAWPARQPFSASALAQALGAP